MPFSQQVGQFLHEHLESFRVTSVFNDDCEFKGGGRCATKFAINVYDLKIDSKIMAGLISQ